VDVAAGLRLDDAGLIDCNPKVHQRSYVNPQPSNFFEALRDQIDRLGPTIVTNLARTNLPRVHTLAMLATPVLGRSDAGEHRGKPEFDSARRGGKCRISCPSREYWGYAQLPV
jgi:hypothetical protein